MATAAEARQDCLRSIRLAMEQELRAASDYLVAHDEGHRLEVEEKSSAVTRLVALYAQLIDRVRFSSHGQLKQRSPSLPEVHRQAVAALNEVIASRSGHGEHLSRQRLAEVEQVHYRGEFAKRLEECLKVESLLASEFRDRLNVSTSRSRSIAGFAWSALVIAAVCCLVFLCFSLKRFLADGREREQVRKELQLQNQQLQESSAALENKVEARTAELKEMQLQNLDMVQEAGKAEIATGALHNIGNVLNSVNVSANIISEQLAVDSEGRLAQAIAMLVSHRQQLDEFLSHDPKGRHLLGYLENAVGKLQDRKQGMENELKSLLKNIAHVRDVVSMQQKHAKNEKSIHPVNVYELIDDAIELGLLSKLQDLEIKRSYRRRPDRQIVINKHKFLQVLVNFIANAQDAIVAANPHEKVIEIDIEYRLDESVAFSVRDTGVGMSAEVIEQLFQHGFTTKKRGHGFGLHSSAAAIKSLGGRIDVESEGPGAGSRFTAIVPAEPSEKLTTCNGQAATTDQSREGNELADCPELTTTS